MNSKRIWGWWFFDWASQPFATLLMAFIFPVYYAEVARHHFAQQGMDTATAAAAAQELWGTGLTISGVIIAVLAPILGAIADNTGRRLVWVWVFSGFYVLGSAGLWYLMPEQPNLHFAITSFAIGLIGIEFATIFTNAMLPGLASRDEIGRVSGSGFAFGYVGGVVSLAVVLLFLAEDSKTGLTLLGLNPPLGLDASAREGTRATGPFVALWYIVFMLPFLFWVSEPKGPKKPLHFGSAMMDLWDLIKSLRHRRSLASWLASSMLSRDALNALYAFGGVYAGTVLGWSIFMAGIFGVVSAISAAVISWIGGLADRRWGPMPVIIICSSILCLVCVVLVGMSRTSFFGMPLEAGSNLPDTVFFICGVAIGGAGGALQSASRTLMVRHTSPARATEAFGLYALSGKATAFLAPALITLVTSMSGSQRLGISPLILLFLLSLILLIWVKPEGEPEQ
ncbi:MFS transporter [Paracoccus sulfuroxidans]|uniref:UMF1 family MFS transporter n=1 Tax=Paracoccus sulfuroxidans TaxID=384678 RepID=A0A562N7D1_9RHOB|nr:MFS transporter [Paracoccus sulfuroxidans]TWI28075.1 UMF1 family MFS transporter [Paracoccus sulfuroxidans]